MLPKFIRLLRFTHVCVGLTFHSMRPLTEEEQTTVFSKLANYIVSASSTMKGSD